MREKLEHIKIRHKIIIIFFRPADSDYDIYIRHLLAWKPERCGKTDEGNVRSDAECIG